MILYTVCVLGAVLLHCSSKLGWIEYSRFMHNAHSCSHLQELHHCGAKLNRVLKHTNSSSLHQSRNNGTSQREHRKVSREHSETERKQSEEEREHK